MGSSSTKEGFLSMSFYIEKYSGEKELFDIKKFSRSLKRAGASQQVIQSLVQEISSLPSLRTTKDIYEFALARLSNKSPSLAARYNIKNALRDLGPSGFPFEHFIAELFKAQQYTVLLGTIMQGKCVSHELDVVATRNNHSIMIECKFHNQQGLSSDVKVPLYIKARFDDIRQHNHQLVPKSSFEKALIVTNTRFTSQAITYAECVGIELLSWSYPNTNNLAMLIEKLQLHPITALTNLTGAQKKRLIEHGFVLCKDVYQHTAALKSIGIAEQDIEHLAHEIHAVCSINHTD